MFLNYKIVKMAANGANAAAAAAAITGRPAQEFANSSSQALEVAKQKVIADKEALIALKAELQTKIDELDRLSGEQQDAVQAKIAEIDATLKNFENKFRELKDSILKFVDLKFKDLEKQKASGDKYKDLFKGALGLINSISDGVGEISNKVAGVTSQTQ